MAITQNDESTIYDSLGYKRVIDLQIELEEIEGVANLAGESCDEQPLSGVFGVIERRLAAVREGLNDLIPTDEPKTGNGTPAPILTNLQRVCENLSQEECARRIEAFNYDVSRNLAADEDCDDYTVRHTWTLKGLQHFLAELEFLQSLLPDYGPTDLYRQAVSGNAPGEPDEEQAMMDRDEDGPALDLYYEISGAERELRGLLDNFPNRPLYDGSAVLDDEARKHLTTAASVLQFANHCILQASKRTIAA